MTPDQMAELAARLRYEACAIRATGQHIKDADDLDAIADRMAGVAQRVPLSDEQIRALVQPMDWPPSVTEIVRAVEQAHGIKEQGYE